MMAGPEPSEGYTGRFQYSTAGYDCEVLVLQLQIVFSTDKVEEGKVQSSLWKKKVESGRSSLMDSPHWEEQGGLWFYTGDYAE